MMIVEKITENNNRYIKPSGKDNINDILKNLENTINILQNMYQRTKELKYTKGQLLDKVVPLVHKVHSAANDALTEFNYRLR